MRIVVCLPGDARGRLDEAIDRAMAPFMLDFTRGEELDIWDAWTIKDEGAFVPLPGWEGDRRLIRGGSDRGEALECAGGPRGLLDLSANEVQAADLAGQAWDLWADLELALPPAEPYSTFYARVNGRTYSSDQASEEYRAQPLVRAFDTALRELRVPGYDSWFLGFIDPVLEVGAHRRECFVRRQVGRALPRRNVLTLGGWWCEDGGRGIHGACHSPKECPHEPEIPTGQSFVDAYLRDVPEDVLLVNLRCHV
ncbi:hypothetical protein [Actinacidiphila rubida]|nr:hypothetical protein [Actinacidiphila rubida]